MSSSGFVGTGRLIKLALRRDRIKLPLWIFIILAMVGGSVPALNEFYGTYEQRAEYAATTAPSVIGRAFAGPVDGPTLGSIAMVELFVFTAILIAFMSTLAVVRHTRQNEELGASEIIGSGVVGRYAQAAAALIVTIGLNLVVGVLLFAVLSANKELPLSGSAGMVAAWVLIGIVFAGIASITTQIAESTRGANGMAGGSIGAFFLIRAIGDGFGSVNPDGLSASSTWLSWLSPFGWGSQLRPFTVQNWWILGLLAITSAVLIGIAVIILRRRDVGSGLIAIRPGPAIGSKRLLSPLGLAWRLQRGVLYGWLAGYIIFGLVVGGMANEFSELITNNEAGREYITSLGGTGNLTDVFFAAMFNMGAIVAAGYALQALLRLRSEETAGHAESLLSTSVGRIRWMLSHIAIAVFGIALLMTTYGFAAGLSNMLVGAGTWHETLRLTASTLVYMPAITCFGAIMLFLFGFAPSLVLGLSWGIFVLTLLINQLGALLKLPQMLINLSPFTHVPSAPSSSITFQPVITLLIIGLLLASLGIAAFTRRDLTTS